MKGKRLIVWVDGWQQECCGQPWAIGSVVDWALTPVSQEHRLTALFSAEAGVLLDTREEHHGGLGDDTERTRGTVIAVRAVQGRQESKDGGDDLFLVPGSARLTPLTHSNGDELRWDGFLGYLVELNTSEAT